MGRGFVGMYRAVAVVIGVGLAVGCGGPTDTGDGDGESAWLRLTGTHASPDGWVATFEDAQTGAALTLEVGAYWGPTRQILLIDADGVDFEEEAGSVRLKPGDERTLRVVQSRSEVQEVEAGGRLWEITPPTPQRGLNPDGPALQSPPAVESPL